MGGGFKPFYKDPLSAPTRDTERFQVFMGTVMSVDWERGVCTVEDIRSRYTYREVAILPCAHGSFESTSVQMPEVGSTCLCVPLWYVAGHAQVAVLTWTVSNIKTKLDAISRKDFESIPDLNERKRGNYRKAWAGDQGASYSGGYTEKIDSGWDRQSRGLDREDVDAHRRTWSTVTSRHVRYSDAGLGFEGPVVRPDAANITPTVMPDGSREYALYLQPGSQITDRYVGGKQDVLPFAENVSKVQEFALDYPLPPEVLQTALVDFVLGTTQNPWQRTTVSAQGKFQVDSQTYFAAQDFDHPTDLKKPALGPTLNEGATPLRKGFIMERSEGTLVGYSRFDASTYGQVLKPVLSDLTPNTALNGGGRFGADFHSGYNPVVDSTDHIEARLAASCHSVRFPNEYNTTRWDVSKEGMLTFEVGSTMPKEKIQFQPANAYEHPHGAGRSVEGHLVGSLKLVVGKNRDEEDSIDLQAIGQTVLRLGCDDATLPDSGRKVETQIRGSADAVQQRTLQYWAQPKYGAGDAVTLENKKGMESVSLRMATDGAIVARVGARKDKVPVLRKHIINGYSDGPGRQQDPSAKNSHSPGRPIYGAGDSVYAFTHGTGSTQYTGLSQAGSPQGLRGQTMVPYNDWLKTPVPGGMDACGQSVDFHAVRDVLLRIGRNPSSGQSLLLDLDGGIVVAAGKDLQGRSLTGALDGGVELTIGQSSAKKGLRLEINGDVDMMVYGNMHQHVTGTYILECAAFRQITKTDHVVTAQRIVESALSRHTTEAVDIVHNEGSYASSEDATDFAV